MKKLFTTTIAIIFMSAVFAQAPEKLSYQAVIRNGNSQLVTNQAIGVRITILKGSPAGSMVYREIYNPDPQTDGNGLVSIDIGTGLRVTGTFSEINWANGPYYLEIETDLTGGTNYSITGISQLLSVPYAKYAKTSGNSFTGVYNDLTGKPDFSAYDKDSTDDVMISGVQIIAGTKTFSDTIGANSGLNAGNESITNLADPADANDAATKAYVDALIFQLHEQGILKIKDADGNTYKIKKIGSRVWMTENLKTTKYNDGTSIPLVTNDAVWQNESTGAYTWYNNNESGHKDTYGALYNWYAVNTGKLCPTGWHVPDVDEWSALIVYLGYENVAGGKLKEAGTIHWISPNTGATNESGFTALPGGFRDGNAEFDSIGQAGSWWSSWFNYHVSESAVGITLYHNTGHITMPEYTKPFYLKSSGLSVRCIED